MAEGEDNAAYDEVSDDDMEGVKEDLDDDYDDDDSSEE